MGEIAKVNVIFLFLSKCNRAIPCTLPPHISDLLKNIQFWAESLSARDPDYFPTLASQQNPKYLWIGCSDSRVPANEVVGLMPGELFVHRNVANMVVATDMNLLSVLQFAVDVLKVEHIIVCGHYGCGGVKVALDHKEYGLIDNWLRSLKGIFYQHKAVFARLSPDEQVDLLCEMNVARQVTNLCHTTIVQNVWLRGEKLAVHGWIYGLKDGLIKDLQVSIDGREQLDEAFLYAL